MVGSYPVVKSVGLKSLIDPLHSAVEVAVSDQLKAGIDIISDGQVRGDMVTAFTSKLPGINGQKVVGTIEPPARPITIGDTKYALTRHPLVKGIVTGPSTIAHALQIATPAYRNREELIMDLAQALLVEAKGLEKAGVSILQIDEPILSTGMADMQAALESITIIASELNCQTCLHVCGELVGVIDAILKMPVTIFDFEFAGSERNLDVLSHRDLKGRMIGYGCVDSSDPAVESVATIQKRIERGAEIFHPEMMLIDPDCGLRMLSRDAAYAKLKNMVDASRKMRIELS
ncbi:MAG TPA: methionine synthase [Methanomicrobiales archaeon]|nr:methionine synthase [Methanomicrobiales archaeon]